MRYCGSCMGGCVRAWVTLKPVGTPLAAASHEREYWVLAMHTGRRP